MPGGGYRQHSYEHRRTAQRVFVDRATCDVVLRLHETDIVRVTPAGDVRLTTGGWATDKTLNSMNDALEHLDMAVENEGGAVIAGRWLVYDSDGTVHCYHNSRDAPSTIIHSKGGQDRERAKWLADAFGVPYSAPAGAAAAGAGAAGGPRVAALASPPSAARAQVMHAPPAPQAAAPAANGVRANSWAKVAATRSAATAAAARSTGPGASSGRITTGPGAAAGAHPQRGGGAAAGPPGFAPASSNGGPHPAAAAAAPAGLSARVQQQQPAPAARPRPAAAPVDVQLEQQMQRLGMTQDELDDDDAHLCVVCMEEPRTSVLVPCGHMALCKDCCEQIISVQKQNCPMCCQPVEYAVEVDGEHS